MDPLSPTYSSLLIAYPHLYHKLGAIPAIANEITYASPQSGTSQVTPLPHGQAYWNLYTIAVWNKAARLHLNSRNPTWMFNLACDNLKQIGTSSTLLTFPYTVQTLRQRLVSRNLKNFTQTKCKLPSAPKDLLWLKWPPFPIIPNWDSQ